MNEQANAVTRRAQAHLAATHPTAGYVQVHFKEKRRPIYLEVKGSDATFLRGVEVNRSGDPIIPRGADERVHLIQHEAIAKLVVHQMNRTYGELEPVGAT